MISVGGVELWSSVTPPRFADRPTVAFLPGAGSIGLEFDRLRRELARDLATVIYDRGGIGWSGPAHLPRSAADVTRELRVLKRELHVDGPLVLVGHSLGGAYAQHAAATIGPWHRSNGAPPTNGGMNEDFRHALRHAGIDRKATVHWLRHTYTTMSEHAGIPWVCTPASPGTPPKTSPGDTRTSWKWKHATALRASIPTCADHVPDSDVGR